MKKAHDPYVPAVPKHIHNQNMVDWRFERCSEQKYGVYIAHYFGNGEYFDPDLYTFPTRALTYNFAKRCESTGDKIISYTGFQLMQNNNN